MIKVYNDLGIKLPFKSFEFSGGEVSVKFDEAPYGDYLHIVAEIKSSKDVMELLMVTDALRRSARGTKLFLKMPYIPYARQDRVMASGESLSIKVFADLINSQNYESVTVWDSHSDVSTALINNCINIKQSQLLIPSQVWERKNTVLVAPDAGAIKKIYEFANAWGNDKVVLASKNRDVNTGKITGTTINTNIISTDQDFLIVDDICDGGYTFTELAKVLKPLTTGKIHLLVTHGIFSKGIEVFDGLIDQITVINNINNAVSTEKTKVITIMKELK